MSKNDSPCDLAREIALAVHRLVAQPDDLREFRRQTEPFMPEAAEWWRQQQAMKRQAKRTLWAWAEAIADERKAVEAEKAKPRLTDPERAPGKDWQWLSIILDPRDRNRVEGWFPSEAVEARAFLCELSETTRLWPGPNPSMAAKFALLATLHDLCLPYSHKILDFGDAVAKDKDQAWWASTCACFWCIPVKKGDAERLDALKGFLEEVKVALAAHGPGDTRRRGADKAKDARILRQIVKAFREWGRKAGPPGRKPEDVPEEERDAARKALLLAVKNLSLITWAEGQFGSSEGVRIVGNVFEKLKTAAADHDRGGDLGGYWN